MIKSNVNHLALPGPLVKWLNTLPSQGSIHGFEFRTGYQYVTKTSFEVFFYVTMYKILIKFNNKIERMIKWMKI